jgi:hypothetical protein
MVQDTTLDRSSTRDTVLSSSARVMASYAEQLGLSDPWRFNFSSTKAHSFFSHVHRTYSRINFFLVDDRLLSKVDYCKYHRIVLSDHAPPPPLRSTYLRSYAPSRQWLFNFQMLFDDNFKEFLTSQI